MSVQFPGSPVWAIFAAPSPQLPFWFSAPSFNGFERLAKLDGLVGLDGLPLSPRLSNSGRCDRDCEPSTDEICVFGDASLLWDTVFILRPVCAPAVVSMRRTESSGWGGFSLLSGEIDVGLLFVPSEVS